MKEMNELEREVASLLQEIVDYNVKPNKSKSARVRLKLGELKKKVTGTRSLLVAADKTGY